MPAFSAQKSIPVTLKIHRAAAARLAVATAAAVTAISACSLPSQATRPPRPADWTAITAYLDAHPVPARKAWRPGFLVQSTVSGYACLDGICHTWSGTVVQADGKTVTVSSDEGDDALDHIVFPGDYFYFPASSPADSASDVQIIQHGAVKIH